MTAEKLIPRDHGFGVQRVPLETDYFEAYNRDNVHLVDINETPIERVTATGLRTRARDYEFDISSIPPASTPSQAAYDQIDITGIGGEKLADEWRRTVDLSRHAGARLPEPPDADRAAERLRLDEFSARHRERRRLVHGAAASTSGAAATRARSRARRRSSAGPPMWPRCTRSC